MSPFDAKGAGANSASGAGGAGQTSQKLFPSTVPAKDLIRVAIVDDEEPDRWLLRRILDQSGEYECVGAYASGEEALREVPAVRPQIVLMDIRMSGISGIQCMQYLKSLVPGLIVILVSGLVDAETVSQAMQAGGDDYLTKPFTVAQCLVMLRFSFGECRAGQSKSVRIEIPPEVAGLTERENEVMRCMAKGLLYKEIADELKISLSAVHKHQHKIYFKLNVTNRTEALGKWTDPWRASP